MKIKVRLLILSYLLISIQNHAFCTKAWGPGKVENSKKNICYFISGKSIDPSYLTMKLNKWDKKQNLYVTIKVNKVKSLKGIRFDFLDIKNNIVDVYEIPKYTDPDFNIIQEDSKITLSIPTSQLKKIQNKKIEHLGVYIATEKDNNVEFIIKEILQTKKKYQGRISITFDDGYLSNIEAAKIMSSYKIAATGYFIPSAIDKKEYISWSDLKRLESMGWAISSHMTTPLTDIPIRKLQNRLKITKAVLKNKAVLKKTTDHFALPLGKHNKNIIKVLKNVYKSNRLASGGIESLPPADLYRLKVINVLEKTSPEVLFQQAKAAIENKEWAIFMLHYIDSPEKKDLNYSMHNFKQFIKLIAPFNKNIKSVDTVISELK